jgi:hypothetical protein
VLLQLLWRSGEPLTVTTCLGLLGGVDGRFSMFYGGSGLLLVLGIVLLVLGYALLGVICVVLALVGGGFGVPSRAVGNLTACTAHR